jgi:hypothetical protein
MRHILGALLVVASLSLASATQASIFVNNFSFETPQTNLFTNDIPGWTPVAGNPFAIGVQSFATIALSYNNGVQPPDGTQVGYVNYGGVYQDVGVAIIPGTYTLSAFFGRRTDDPGASSTLNLYTTGGTLLATTGPITPTLGAFQLFSVSYAAAANDPNLGQGLRIQINNLVPQANAQQTDFDLVVLNGPNGPAVSEPSGLGMLACTATSAAGLWRMLRRPKRQARSI